MRLACARCKNGDFRIIDSVAFGPSASADETTIQRAFCTTCDACFVCEYTERRSFHSDRDDRASHLCWTVARRDWIAASIYFQAPTRRVSSAARRKAVRAFCKASITGTGSAAIQKTTAPVPTGSGLPFPSLRELPVLQRCVIRLRAAFLR